MIESEERHYKECKLGDECERCFWISEAHWALSEAGMTTQKIEPYAIHKESGFIQLPTTTSLTPQTKKHTTFNSHEEKVNYIIKKFKGEIIK